jgi:SAM-dependent methyltransferase
MIARESLPRRATVTDVRHKAVDYDQVAPTYDRRFVHYAGEGRGVGGALLDLARAIRAERILEVGCGTGHWLGILRQLGCHVYGMDPSAGMVQRARESLGLASLVRARADAVPFRSGELDLVFCVNALHHFADPAGFIRAARVLLRPGGALSVIGMNPHAGRDRWDLYEYFPGTYETDLRRYPSSGALTDWMIAAGFDDLQWQVAERLVDTGVGRDILEEPMLQKQATSQLTLLTDAEYENGLARIRAAVAKAETAGEHLVFTVDISLAMVTGRVKNDAI